MLMLRQPRHVAVVLYMTGRKVHNLLLYWGAKPWVLQGLRYSDAQRRVGFQQPCQQAVAERRHLQCGIAAAQSVQERVGH